MATSTIDLSAGLVPKQKQPSGGGIDLSAGLKPVQQQQTEQPAYPSDLLVNDKGEGLYRFIDANQVGKMAGVIGDAEPTPEQQQRIAQIMKNPPVVYLPYSKALAVMGNPQQHIGPRGMMVQAFNAGNSQGYDKYGLSIHPDEAERILRDVEHDPRLQGQGWKNTLYSIPAVQAASGFMKSAARTVSGADTLVRKATGHNTPTLSGVVQGGKPPRTKVEQAIQDYGEQPTYNPFEGVDENTAKYMSGNQALGGYAEDMGEFLSGEELLSALGKVVKAPVALADAAKIEQEMKKGSVAGRLFQQALKQGTVAGGQTYVKTGGDAGAAATAGLTTAGLTGGMGAVSEGAGNLLRKFTPEATATAPRITGAERYGEMAGEQIRPHLEAVNAAGGEGEIQTPARTVEHDTGLVDERGKPITRTETIPGKTVEAVPKIDVDEAINNTGDYTRARQELADGLNSVQAHMDAATGGEYTRARNAMTKAENLAESGDPDAVGKYTDAQNHLDEVIADSGAKPEMKSALRAGWRQYYVLGTVSRKLDAALDGLPGDTKVSYEQRGINGKTLLNGLRSMILNPKIGRAGVAQALGGEERLKALEAIGNATTTNAGRSALNKAMRVVAYNIPRVAGQYAGWKMTGHWLGAVTGGEVASATVNASKEGTARVMRAMMSNPEIANHLLFAVDSGAKPENYGPLIGSLIQKWESAQSYEQQRREQEQKEDEQQ